MTTPSAPAELTPESGQKSAPNIWFWLSGALLVLVLVVGVVVAVAPRNADENAAPVPTSTVPAPDTSDSICGLPAGDQSIPTVSAPDTVWELVGKMAAPTVENVGPGVINDDGIRTCFAHSPMGAVLAYANYGVLGSHPELAYPAMEYAVAPGPGREIALEGVRTNTPQGNGGTQYVGFRVESYTDAQATVSLAARNAHGVLAEITADLVWIDGDWKMSVQDNGQSKYAARAIPNLAGYVPWSGA